MDEAQAYFNEINRLEGEKIRHHPSSETGKLYSEIKKKGISNQLRKDFDVSFYQTSQNFVTLKNLRAAALCRRPLRGYESAGLLGLGKGSSGNSPNQWVQLPF